MINLTPPTCQCGATAITAHPFYSKENRLTWLCSKGHATQVTYCSESDVAVIKEYFRKMDKAA